MPAAPTPIRLGLADVLRVLGYLEDNKHRNHRAYSIHPPSIGGAAGAGEFFEILTYAMWVLNQDRSDRELIKTAAFWYVFSFAKKSWLTAAERSSYLQTVLLALGCEEFSFATWHVHRKNGEADLNIVAPHISLEPFPELNRSRKFYHLARARRRSDEWANRANLERESTGMPPIPVVNVFAEDSHAGIARLGRLIMGALPESAEAFAGDQLRPALKRAGFEIRDWDITIGELLRIYRWPTSTTKQECRRPYKVKVREVVEFTRLLLQQRMRKRRTKVEKDSINPRVVNTALKNRADCITAHTKAEIQLTEP